MVRFRLFARQYKVSYVRFGKLMNFSGSVESRVIMNFDRVEFTEKISGKTSRIRFSGIHHPTLRFLHRWLSFTLFPTRELCSVTLSELRCMYVMVKKIWCVPVA